MWAITSYYNPIGFKSRLRNYRLFRERLPLPLVTVELAYNGQFQLDDDDAEMLIRITGRDVLWQKERLLNLAMRTLPDDCDRFAWIDCDVIIADDDWVSRATAALDQYAIIQPFSTLHELPKDRTPESVEPSELLTTMPSLAARLAIDPLDDVLGVPAIPLKSHMMAYGFAWAARRDVLEPHGLYDACVVGGGDRAMICGALGVCDYAIESMRMNEPRAAHYLAWAEPFARSVQARVGHIEATAYHLWHGSFADRKYRSRHEDFSSFGYDPATDLAVEETGCLRWNSDKPEMHEWVRAYFEHRREDG